MRSQLHFGGGSIKAKASIYFGFFFLFITHKYADILSS